MVEEKQEKYGLITSFENINETMLGQLLIEDQKRRLEVEQQIAIDPKINKKINNIRTNNQAAQIGAQLAKKALEPKPLKIKEIYNKSKTIKKQSKDGRSI
jgi:uncharacterized protein YaaW (UPF0174 family)